MNDKGGREARDGGKRRGDGTDAGEDPAVKGRPIRTPIPTQIAKING